MFAWFSPQFYYSLSVSSFVPGRAQTWCFVYHIAVKKFVVITFLKIFFERSFFFIKHTKGSRTPVGALVCHKAKSITEWRMCLIRDLDRVTSTHSGPACRTVQYSIHSNGFTLIRWIWEEGKRCIWYDGEERPYFSEPLCEGVTLYPWLT